MKIRILSILLVIVFSLTNCIKSSKPTDPAEFAEYITGYTAGVISKKDPVRIRLAAGNSKFEIGKPIPDDILKFLPAVKGTTILYAEDMLVFKPSEDWPAGKSIKGILNLGKILDVPDKFSTFEFQFSIIQPSFSVYPGNLVSTGEKEKKMKKIEGKLVTADVMDIKDVEKLLTATSNGKDFPVKWETGAGMNEFNFVVDSLPRMENPYNVKISWNGRPLDIDLKDEYTFEIPSINDFIFISANVSQGEEQYIDILLSDPVDPTQDLNGLVYLKEGDPIRLVPANNIIRLYPSQRLSGSRTLIVESSVRNDVKINSESEGGRNCAF